MYAAVGTQQETVFPLDAAHESAQLHRKTWATSYDSLPSSTALDDGLDPQPNHHLDRCLTICQCLYCFTLKPCATQAVCLLCKAQKLSFLICVLLPYHVA